MKQTNVTHIIKRNGQVVPFDNECIESAIYKAFCATNIKGARAKAKELSNKVIEKIFFKYDQRALPAVEKVQDLVEETLMKEGYVETAKKYILYRDQHRKLRHGKEILLDIQKTMDGYLDKQDWRVSENSSVNYSLGGLILHNSGAITAHYWLNHIYSKEIAQAHAQGEFHIHDLSMFSGYCAGWSLRQLLELGLGGVEGKISAKPAKHFSTALWQMINFLGTMQNEWAGAQAFSSFDTYLAPFVRNDQLGYKEVKQCLQCFVYSLNTPSRWGTQPPFSNITLDWVVPEDLKSEPVILGGVPGSLTYGEYQKELDLINRAFLDVMLEGDANGRVFSYPIPTYNLTNNFDWEGENATRLFELTAKYGTPYFQNFVNSDLNPSDVRSMCCRLRLDKRELKKRGGGLFGADEFTGSIGVVTLNMPRLGFLSRSEEEFFSRLDQLINLAKDSLECKRKVIEKLMGQGLFPYTRRYLKHFDNHFSTIGITGMHECCLNFLGESIIEEGGKLLTLKTLDFIKERLSLFQETTGNLYNLEASPAESTAYRFAKMDKTRYPKIIQSGTNEAYYTNSSQLPVNHTDNLFDALEIQEPLQKKYTGGTVFHVFLGEALPNAQSCKTLVRQIVSNFQLPYISITPTFSICTEHGYFSGKHEVCPRCGGETEIYSRITGYYRPVRQWNFGKKEEFSMRRTFHAVSELPSYPIVQGGTSIEEGVRPSKKGTLSERGTALLFFYSDHCPKCFPIKSYLKETAVGINFINVSEEKGLMEAKKFQVKALPTFLVRSGNETKMMHDLDAIRKCVTLDLSNNRL